MSVIDVHCHVVPRDFPTLAPTCTCAHQWPQVQHDNGGRAAVMIGGREFRRIDHRSWDVQRRLQDMDAEDVGLQVLSPMPELLSYWLPLAEATQMCRHVNTVIGEMVAREPRRFAGLGQVPLQDPHDAARALESLRREHGLLGVEIGSNIAGRSPGDPFFDPFWAEAERLDLCVFVHALHPVGMDRIVGPRPLAAFIGFPTDTGLAAASLITGRTLEKFPRLRVAFSHGGGTLAALLPRLQNGWAIAPELAAAFASPTQTARRFYFDNLSFDASWLQHLVGCFGIDQVFAGSDYPFLAGQSHPGRPFDALALSGEARLRLRSGNALRYLGLAAAP